MSIISHFIRRESREIATEPSVVHHSVSPLPILTLVNSPIKDGLIKRLRSRDLMGKYLATSDKSHNPKPRSSWNKSISRESFEAKSFGVIKSIKKMVVDFLTCFSATKLPVTVTTAFASAPEVNAVDLGKHKKKDIKC